MEQAAEWYALLRAGQADANQHADWQAWLARSAEHRQAWSYVEAISQRFQPLQAITDPRHTANALWRANERVVSRRRVLGGIIVLTGVGTLGLAGWHRDDWPDFAQGWGADQRSGNGEIRSLRLADGSQVWLNSASAFDQELRHDLRRLRLLRGEILIDTASDPLRPFVVDTPQGRLRALGTRFSVRREGHYTRLCVYQGAVEVRPLDGSSKAVIPAGRQVLFDSRGPGDNAPADPARELWTQGLLVARDIPLREVIEQLRPFHNGYLGVADEVAGLRVFGSFPLNDSRTALAMLVDALPLRLHQPLPWWSSLQPVAGED
ncbi:FecR family protein [Pseudomonas sp. ABC1]|nr:FecR family protein [Pseudomonas sp. ABC1]